MKKFLALLLALAMVIAVAPAAFAEETSEIIAHETVEVLDGDLDWGGEYIQVSPAYSGTLTIFAVAEDKEIDVSLQGADSEQHAVVFSFPVSNTWEYESFIYGGKSDGTGKVSYTVIQETEGAWSVLAQGSVEVLDGDPSWGGEPISFTATGNGTAYIYAVADDQEKAVELVSNEECTTEKAMVFTAEVNPNWGDSAFYIWGGKSDNTGKVTYTLMLTGDAGSAGGDEGGSGEGGEDGDIGGALGSYGNPDSFPGDSWNIHLDAPYYYSYYAVEGGTLSVTVSGMSGSDDSLTINNDEGVKEDDNAAAWSADENGNYVVSAYVKADETVKVCVNCWSGADVSVSVSFVPGEPEGGDDQDEQLPDVDAVAAPELPEGQEWEWVDVFEETVDTAVLGADGFYHLNSADGPVLFIDLKEAETLDLVSAFRNHTSTYNAYLAAVPDGVVALNQEWIDIMQNLNVDYAWILWVDQVYDDAWMCLCKYSESITSMGTENGGTGDNGENKDDITVTPSTADNSAVMMTMATMILATGAVVVILTNKKKFA